MKKSVSTVLGRTGSFAKPKYSFQLTVSVSSYANCVNLNEVLVEGADPEFDDTDPFRNELEQVVFEDIEYEIESETFTMDENSIEWYKTVHPSDDKLINYMYDTGENLEWDDIEEFLYDKLSKIDDAKGDMHVSQFRKFMLDRLANQNINIIDGLEQTENGMKEVDPNTGELQD